MAQKTFYITTPLYYVNDHPHLGTAYSTVIADIFNRYHKLFGRETFFLTGTDEHGQKCEQAARERGLSSQEHCDQMREHFKKAWKVLNIEYTPIGEKDSSFFYTTHKYYDDQPDHTKIVQRILQKLKDQGDIYSAHYKGWYCVSEEIFYMEKDLKDGQSPLGKEVIPLEEEAWFFKMSKYQKDLQKYLEDHNDFIKPLHRQNEIKGFLKKPLQDLCISRPKKRVSWGVELPFDKDCVVYVWVDALLNYITGVGYGAENDKDKSNFEKYWTAGAVHLIGKDILMTHAVYWSCLLMALELPLPKTIFAHGWLLNKESEKMSKSQGDTLDPMELSRSLGVCELRYFLARYVTLGKDSSISKSLMMKRINEDLADGLGNIFSRVSRLIEKHFEGVIPSPAAGMAVNNKLKNQTEKICAQFQKQIKNFELSQALEALSFLMVEVNKYLEQKAPWKLVQSDKKAAGIVLYNSLEVLRISAILLFPVMPKKMEQLLADLGEEPNFKHIQWGSFPFKKSIQKPQPLFPKIQS